MKYFDRFCFVLAFGLGCALLVLGSLGLFLGCKAHFTLPPVFGVVPALVGWGITRAVYLAWLQSIVITPAHPQPCDDAGA